MIKKIFQFSALFVLILCSNAWALSPISKIIHTLPEPPSQLVNHNRQLFGNARWDSKLQVLFTEPTADFYDAQHRRAYQLYLLETLAWWVSEHQIGLRIVDPTMYLLKRTLESQSSTPALPSVQDPNTPYILQQDLYLPTLQAIKYWFGKPDLTTEFQLEIEVPGTEPVIAQFIPSRFKGSQGWELLMQPKFTWLLNGPGTIGRKVLIYARQHGFRMLVVKNTPDYEARDLALRGFPIVVSDESKVSLFQKAEIPVYGIISDILGRGEAQGIIDATDGDTRDKDGREITVAAYNKKYIYDKFPKIPVVYQAGEKPGIGELFEATNFSMTGRFGEMRGHSLQIPSCNTHSTNRIAAPAFFHYPRIDQLDMHLDRRSTDATSMRGGISDGTAIQPASTAKKYWEAIKTLVPPHIWAKIKGSPTTTITEVDQTHFHTGELKINAPGISAEKYAKILQKERSRVAVIGLENLKDKGRFNTIELLKMTLDMLPGGPHLFLTPAAIVDLEPNRIQILFATPQESNVVPDNINALHAITGYFGGDASIRLVDQILSIDLKKDWLENMLPAYILFAESNKLDVSL